jgi:hypothetical protein
MRRTTTPHRDTPHCPCQLSAVTRWRVALGLLVLVRLLSLIAMCFVLSRVRCDVMACGAVAMSCVSTDSQEVQQVCLCRCGKKKKPHARTLFFVL